MLNIDVDLQFTCLRKQQSKFFTKMLPTPSIVPVNIWFDSAATCLIVSTRSNYECPSKPGNPNFNIHISFLKLAIRYPDQSPSGIFDILRWGINFLTRRETPILQYLKVSNSELSRLVACFRNFILPMTGKFKVYVLWPSAKRVQNWIVDRSTARDFTVDIS